MPILSDDVEEVTMQVHRVLHHGICANQSDMRGDYLDQLDCQGKATRSSVGKAGI